MTRNMCAPVAMFQNQWCLSNETASALTLLTTGSPVGSINNLLAHYSSFSNPKEPVSQRVPGILPPPAQPRPSQPRSAQGHYALPSVHCGQREEHVCSTSLNLLVSLPQTDTDASREGLLQHPGREAISWTGLPGKDSPSQSGSWRVEAGGGHMGTSGHRRTKPQVPGSEAPLPWALSGGRRAGGSDRIPNCDCGPRGPHFGRLVSISGEASPALHCSCKADIAVLKGSARQGLSWSEIEVNSL